MKNLYINVNRKQDKKKHEHKKTGQNEKNANFKIKTTFWCMVYGSLIEKVCRARPKATPECNVKLSLC